MAAITAGARQPVAKADGVRLTTTRKSSCRLVMLGSPQRPRRAMAGDVPEDGQGIRASSPMMPPSVAGSWVRSNFRCQGEPVPEMGEAAGLASDFESDFASDSGAATGAAAALPKGRALISK